MPTPEQIVIAGAAMDLYNEGNVSGAVRVLEVNGNLAPSLAVSALRLGDLAVAAAIEEAQNQPDGSPRLRTSPEVRRQAREALRRDIGMTVPRPSAWARALDDAATLMRQSNVRIDREAVAEIERTLAASGRTPAPPEIQRIPASNIMREVRANPMVTGAARRDAEALAQAAFNAFQDRVRPSPEEEQAEAQRRIGAEIIAAFRDYREPEPNTVPSLDDLTDAMMVRADIPARASRTAATPTPMVFPMGTRAMTPTGLEYVMTRSGWEAVPKKPTPQGPQRTIFDHILDDSV
jgi:hypothetical protein